MEQTYYLKHRERILKKYRENYQKNKEREQLRHKKYYKFNKKQILTRNKEYREKNKRQLQDYQQQWKRETYHRLRDKIYSVLGTKCKSCEIEDIRVLQIDHIYGNGRKDPFRKSNDVKYLRDKLFSALKIP